ncbi:MAG: thymidylate synthase [Candidatus Nezhaarchaeota archaeon]|nr:thymidylate synthase [Candidatus Nezhaarchaeota archaeon]
MKARDIYEAWFKAVIAVLDYGRWTFKEDSRILEVEDLVLAVENLHRPSKHPEVLEKVGCLGPNQLEVYVKQFLSPDRMGFTYTYGERLRAYSCPSCGSTVDQLSFLREKLSRFQCTNQAVVALYNPLRDSDSSRHGDPPCWNWAQFRLRDGELHVTVVFRSHDYAKALYPNLYAIAMIAEEVQPSKPKKLTLLSSSAHIYEGDYEAVRRNVAPFRLLYKV